MLRKRDEENGSRRNHRNQAGDDASLPGRRHAGGVHGSSGGALRGSTAPDEAERWLRGRATGTRGIRQAAAREQGHDRALQEGQRRADEGGHRRKPAAGAGIGAGAERNVHFHPQGEKSEVKRDFALDCQFSVVSKEELSVAGAELRKKNSLT